MTKELLSIIPPHNTEIEQAIIGTLIAHGDLIQEAKDISPDDFYKEDHGDIFKTLLDLHDEGLPIDYLTVADRMNGLKGYILKVAAEFWPTGNLAMHKRILKEHVFRRQVLKSILSLISNIDTISLPDLKEHLSSLESIDFNTEKHREINLTREIELYVRATNGDFTATECYNIVQEATRATKGDNFTINRRSVKDILRRLCKSGIIQKSGNRDGVYRLVDDTFEEMDILNVSTEAHDIKLPLGLRNLVKIMPRNIIIVAGAKSSGKTAFTLNTAYLNRSHKKGIYYYNSEMGAEELRIRIDEFADTSLTEWNKIKFIERSGNFGDVIKRNPDAIHVIDFLELHDEFYKVGQHIRDVYDALDKGVAIIALQKKPGQSYGYGGSMSIEKSRLYLTLDYGIITITDAKIFAQRGVNPRGMQLCYKLVGGSKYVDSTGWLTPEEYNARTTNGGRRGR